MGALKNKLEYSVISNDKDKLKWKDVKTLHAFSADEDEERTVGRFRIGVFEIKPLNGNEWKVRSRKCTPGIIKKTRTDHDYDRVRRIQYHPSDPTCWEIT